MLLRYKFNDIFTYDPKGGILIPRYTVVINTNIYREGIVLIPNSFREGLNLFQFIGRDMAGEWDQRSRILNVKGFY